MSTKRLEMIFKNEGGKTTKMSVDNAKEDISKEQVEAAMQTIIDKNVFETNSGVLTGIDSARIVTTDIDEIII
ncbi:DUF2922 domain-containing protein [Crassaminicella profunda]|uniref:DUF2922 domain-containing protein n=1 Tax=Crassaminicella profunda TaxID=1286698 RepID=UPI001CA61C8A|nr:DUF2922 domain-containing protein [Crassaminicella profunda]QZY55853.1 DUF2922 domain-containing protein [Crassaminicella profunda]